MKVMSRFTIVLGLSYAAAAPPPQVALIRTLWGVERFDVVSEWAGLFREYARANYTGVEAPTWVVCGTGPSFNVMHDCTRIFEP